MSKCTWQPDEEGGWVTACGNRFVIIEGSPKENGMKFCPYCGDEIE